MSLEWLRVLLLLRMIAFIAFCYLIFGWVIERTSRHPDGKLRGFARLICSPLTKPIAAFMDRDAPYALVLRNTLFATAAVWFLLFGLSEYALPR